jgi:hypothetical protein
MPSGNRVDRHEAYVVAMARVFLAGVAQPGEKKKGIGHRI